MKYSQYEIILVNLDPTIGSEIKKTRPCVIVSPDEMNKHIKTIVVCQITSSLKDYPTRISINQGKINGQIVIDQIRTIDKKRVLKILGVCKKETIQKIKSIINETFVL